MRFSSIIINVCKVVLAIFLPLAILLTIFQYYSYNKDFYMNEFKKYDIANFTSISEGDLDRIADKLIGYIKDDEKDLNIKAVINGEKTEVFGEREKQHMIDVKELFIAARIVKNISFILVFISILLIVLISKKRKIHIYQSLLGAGIIPILFMVILYILVKIDFHKYFIYFHRIFFSNDLWLLDPETDVLIQMLPLEFFIDISSRIIGWFSLISIIMTIVASINLRKKTVF